MGYNVVFKNSVGKDLSRLDKPTARRLLDKIEKELPGQADRQPVLKGEFAGLRKFRIGDHRVIFAIIGNDILILRVGNRKEVYR